VPAQFLSRHRRQPVERRTSLLARQLRVVLGAQELEVRVTGERPGAGDQHEPLRVTVADGPGAGLADDEAVLTGRRCPALGLRRAASEKSHPLGAVAQTIQDDRLVPQGPPGPTAGTRWPGRWSRGPLGVVGDQPGAAGVDQVAEASRPLALCVRDAGLVVVSVPDGAVVHECRAVAARDLALVGPVQGDAVRVGQAPGAGASGIRKCFDQLVTATTQVDSSFEPLELGLTTKNVSRPAGTAITPAVVCATSPPVGSPRYRI
jgi:hypothetical protein